MGSQTKIIVSKPTTGELERTLTQRIQSLYHDHLGQRPSKVICQFFAEKLAITLENAVTPAEQTLVNGGSEDLADQVRADLDKILQPQIQQVIEKVVGKTVIDIMIDTNLETGRTGIIIVLEQMPEVRNPEAIPKAKKEHLPVSDDGE
jgi:uncharacterized protein YbcI